MSGILPRGAVDRVAYFESRIADWSARAAEIGTTPGAVTALQDKTVAARDAYNAQYLAFAQARAATLAFQIAVAAMTSAGTEILQQVKARAATDGDAVYTLALLPVPAQPSPVPPPGTPSGFTVALRGDGSLLLKWKCANPRGSSGTIYQVSRRTGASGEFTVLGAVGRKQFLDATLPAGAAGAASGITYQVTALRSTVAGLPARFTVHFGVATATTAAEPSPKLAA